MCEISRISDCEELTMSVIWDTTDHDMNLQEVMATLKDRYNKNWKPQTISTFLTRLRQKGYLSMYRKGRYAYYQPVVTEDVYRKKQLATTAERFYGGDYELMVKEVMKLGNVTPDQLGEKE